MSEHHETPKPLNLKLELARCLRCGFCYDLAWLGSYSMCPTAHVFGFQSYGAKGKVVIGSALLDGTTSWSKEMINRLYACLDCGACETNCAMAMPLNEIFHALRVETVKRGYRMNTHETLVKNLQATGNIYGLEHEDRASLLPSKPSQAGSDTVYFMGCLGSLLRREMTRTALTLFEKMEMPVRILEEEVCCGYPLWQHGFEDEARALLQQNMRLFKRAGAKKIVFSCPTCYRMFKEIAPQLIGDVPYKLLHVVEQIDTFLAQHQVNFKRPIEKIRVTYHDPCELGRHLGVYDAPRRILQRIPGVALVEMPRAKEYAFCCGGAGKFMVPSDPEFNMKVSAERIAEAQATGASLLVTACPSCKSNLQTAGANEKDTLPVKDLVEFLVERLE